MFLVPTRSPHRVEHFASCPDEFQRSDFHISKREAREEKNKNKNKCCSVSPSPVSFSFSFVFFILLFYFKVGPTCPIFFHFLVRFSSEINHFIPVPISFIIIEYFLNIYHFSRFFSNPVFRFHSTPVAYKFIKYSDCLGI